MIQPRSEKPDYKDIYTVCTKVVIWMRLVTRRSDLQDPHHLVYMVCLKFTNKELHFDQSFLRLEATPINLPNF